jgi:hypothetical protein
MSACKASDHKWMLGIEEGQVSLTTTTCGPDCRFLMATDTHPATGYLGDEREWLSMPPIPVAVSFATACPAYPTDDLGIPTGPPDRSGPGYESSGPLDRPRNPL